MTEIFQNINQLYKYSTPSPDLSDYIEFFSESSFEKNNSSMPTECFTIELFPSWTPTFWINLGEPYYLTIENDRYFIKPEDDILILRNSIVERHNLPADHIFTVKFFPGGLEAILNIKQTRLTNQVVNLKTIMPATFIQRIKKLRSFQERVNMFQEFFRLNHSKNKRQDYYLKFVRDTIATYASVNMQFNNNEIAEKMFTTSKTINRYFNNVIGTTTKNYFSILRARTALTSYVKHKNIFDPSDFGYYDMSHFYKEVIKFTGQKLIEHTR